jgi:amidophosphoribosyltransferase
MCGIVGFLDPDRPVADDLYRGAVTLQHRGQDSAGLVTFQDRFWLQSGLGLWADVMADSDMARFPGHQGLAHLRYATSGTGAANECQPFTLAYPFGLAMVHNGNLTNDGPLRAALATRGYRTVMSGSDSETLLQVFAQALSGQDLAHLTASAVLEATKQTMAQIEGAYAVVILIANHGMVAFRDPQGIRPLVMGRRGRGVAFASESVALDAMDAELWRDVAPGEAVFVDLSGRCHAQQLVTAKRASCAFEYIYLSRPESVIDGLSVAEAREALGVALAERFVDSWNYQAVFDVPSCAEDSAVAFAETTGIPYRRGIRRNPYAKRSFIASSTSQRRSTVGMKFLLDRRAIAGKRVVVVDDSIVRGTTAKALIQRLRQQGAERIALLSAAPRITHPCVYGIDMAVQRDLIAATTAPEQLADDFGVETLQYQSLGDMERALGDRSLCTACFTGCYPTGVDSAAICGQGRARAAVSGENAPTTPNLRPTNIVKGA